MENIQNQGVQDPKENLEEHDDVEIKSEDDIRQQIIDEYEFDEEDDKSKIDKLVSEKLEHQKTLSTAIKQKQTWRGKALKASEALGEPKSPVNQQKDPNDAVKQTVRELLEEEKLNGLSISDEIKKEAQAYAKLNNTSISKALDSDYIKFKMEQEDKEQRVSDASISGSGNSAHTRVKRDFSNVSLENAKEMPDEEWEEFKKRKLKGMS